jgi:predicted phosphodiesterase
LIFFPFIKRSIYLATTAFFITAFTMNASIAQQKNPAKVPFTNLQFNDDTGKVQFAIIADLWGGNRPGVFEDAVDKLNLLQPQFVISVGDLIDGKTHDASLIDKQWNEFNAKVRSLSMPFFYVPGNHDIGNADMEKEWMKRFGRPYYYFIYKNVLFLSVNTQDGGVSAIDQQQIDYFKKAIADNPQVRWTFLFMHRPVWFTNSKNEEGYEKIEAALNGRNYTLFSGHYHTYLSNVKDGNKRFILGSTGGGSELRGEKFGEFDHITLVTLNTGGSPKIVNLKLDGIIKEDVVNEKTYPITNTLIDENWISTPTYVSTNQIEKRVTPEILFNNPTPYPLKVTGSLPTIPGYTINPEKIDLTLAPNTKKVQPVVITSSKNAAIDLSALPFINISLNGAYQYDTVNYQMPSKKRLKLEWETILPEVSNAKNVINDQFKNTDTSGMIAITNPELQNKWYWYGTTDCLIKFKLMHDAKYLYLITFIKDDQLVLNNDQRDILYVHLEDKNGSQTRFSILPDNIKSAIQTNDKTVLDSKDVELKSEVKANGLIKFVLQVPIEKIIKPDHSIRFNIGYRDQDSFPDKENSTLFWKPVWGSETDYKNSGTYLIK